jgi:hypothetical protein
VGAGRVLEALWSTRAAVPASGCTPAPRPTAGVPVWQLGAPAV